MPVRDRFALTTLSDIVAKREAEQEAVILRSTLGQLSYCRAGCGKTVQERLGSDTCAPCTKRGLRPPDPLPEIEPIGVSEVAMPTLEAKTCSRLGCSKKLRSDNTKGVCSVMKTCGANRSDAEPTAAADEEAPDKMAAPKARRTSSPKAPAAAKTLERFRLLAEALDFDPDELLAEFAAGWLERARAAVTGAA